VDYTVPRKAQRVCLKQPVTVRYNRDGHFEFTGISRDLSDTGIFLYTESLIEEGAHVELTLILPSESAEPNPIQVRGRVVRVERIPATGIAVEFDKVTVMPEPSRR
jgi:c-di-GMP-binding flagellar brake protein YcgR